MRDPNAPPAGGNEFYISRGDIPEETWHALGVVASGIGANLIDVPPAAQEVGPPPITATAADFRAFAQERGDLAGIGEKAFNRLVGIRRGGIPGKPELDPMSVIVYLDQNFDPMAVGKNREGAVDRVDVESLKAFVDYVDSTFGHISKGQLHTKLPYQMGTSMLDFYRDFVAAKLPPEPKE